MELKEATNITVEGRRGSAGGEMNYRRDFHEMTRECYIKEMLLIRILACGWPTYPLPPGEIHPIWCDEIWERAHSTWRTLQLLAEWGLVKYVEVEAK